MEKITKKRSTVVACLLALLQPGVGLLYVGRLWLAIALPLTPFALLLLWRLSGLVLLPWGPLPLWALLIVGWPGLIFWIGFTARRTGEVVLAPYQRWYVYVGYFIVVSVFWLNFPFDKLDWLGARFYRIPAVSMSDTLLEGDYIVADSWAYLMGGKPRRGDIVVFELPARPGVRYAKRIIGLPGDRLEGRGGQVYVNQVLLNEPYLNQAYNISPSERWQDWRYTVPEGSYFILGDNRTNSEDSRIWGAIPGGSLFGRVRTICVSFDSKRGLHFDRVAAVR